MDEELRRLQRAASVGDLADKEKYICALERALGLSSPAPILLKGKSANAGSRLLQLLGNRCATAKQLSGKAGRGTKGIKEHLDNLVKLGILDVKRTLNGANVYFAVASFKKCDTKKPGKEFPNEHDNASLQ